VNPAIAFRKVTDNDLPLLMEIFLHSRLHELEPTGWTDAQKRLFLQSQFSLQQRYFLQQYPDADFLLAKRCDIDIGRIYIEHGIAQLHVIDIALLPPFREHGIGTHILHTVIEQARQQNKPVSLHVEKSNRAVRLYQRLGFCICADKGLHWKMQIF